VEEIIGPFQLLCICAAFETCLGLVSASESLIVAIGVVGVDCLDADTIGVLTCADAVLVSLALSKPWKFRAFEGVIEIC
jgi:hypothetical protein